MAKQDNVIRGESWTSRPRTEDPKGEATMPSSVDQSENAVREAPASAAQTLPEDAALKCRSCRKGKYAPPVHMIRLTETREITPYVWGPELASTSLGGSE